MCMACLQVCFPALLGLFINQAVNDAVNYDSGYGALHAPVIWCHLHGSVFDHVHFEKSLILFTSATEFCRADLQSATQHMN